MDNRIHWLGWLGLLGLLGCSGGASSRGAQAATALPSARAPESVPRAKSQTDKPIALAVPEYGSENEHDRVFIENAERAIGEYSEFIARAGASEEYALAVKRSREQIEDLRDSLIFVREGAARRAVH